MRPLGIPALEDKIVQRASQMEVGKDMGAIISEQPFGALPFSGAFPGRNRIIAGMSIGTVVVEAALSAALLVRRCWPLAAGRTAWPPPPSTPCTSASKAALAAR